MPGYQGYRFKISELGRERTGGFREQCPEKLLSVLYLDALVHIFTACMNSFLFFLGQHHQGIARWVITGFA